MSDPNQAAMSHEQNTFARSEIVQFSDGATALGFRTVGDKLALGHDSKHKYARSFNAMDMAIIKTKTGNTYGFAQGLVVNKDRKLAFELPDDTIDVTIGEPCTISGVGSTSDVESVMLRYKLYAPGSEMADHQVDAPSPFKALGAQVSAINESRQQA